MIPAFTSPNQFLHDPEFEIYEYGQRVDYFESPQRLRTLLDQLPSSGKVHTITAASAVPSQVTCHSPEYLLFLERIYNQWVSESPQDAGKFGVLYPTAHPIHKQLSLSTNIPTQLGNYVKDLSAPITSGTYPAAMASAGCAIAAANAILAGERLTLALCRPPGHHAGVASAAGYCYINNAAVAATTFRPLGKVAILDIDYHAGNGTQEIFYEDLNVPVCSIHADPHREYPYFAGFAHETGAGAGLGAHRNLPLPAGTQPTEYLGALDLACDWLAAHRPTALVISAGFDTYAQDPLGQFKITTPTYTRIGQRIAQLGLPTCVILEGGYNIPALPANLLALLNGLSF